MPDFFPQIVVDIVICNESLSCSTSSHMWGEVFSLSHSRGCVLVFHCSVVCSLLVTNDLQQFLMCLVATWIFVQISYPFIVWLFDSIFVVVKSIFS
jgi:hypothetical protein